MMKKTFIFLCFLVVSVGFSLRAAEVDTLTTYSEVMKKQIKAVVVRPADYDGEKVFPVVYLLHGYSGNYGSWVNDGGGEIKELADRYGMLLVCPDGGYSSWYWDSPIDPSSRYETYVARELVDWIDSRYKTIPTRQGRAITGLSMGGHGALYLAFRNQDVFGAAGSTAGGVDIRPFPLNWDMAKRLGAYAEHPEHWDKHTVINMTHLLTPNSLSLIIDCGTKDFFYGVNEALHQKLQDLNIPHTYITSPGGHNWDYWRNSIRHQLLYFSQNFKDASSATE